MRKTLAVAMVMLVMFGGVPVAKADDTDEYIRVLNAEGIGHRGSREQLIHLGHTICSDLGTGRTALQEMKGMFASANMSENDAAMLVVAAINEYCPEYKSELDAIH